ncbi:response regulator transcription factor [Nocardiopsis sp. NPDC049922]|uniref:response regulator transcription factor n=1 Tax=Nocardiopsis sp. NPDC049922 TaxID=3155157 RepID=UPI0033EF6C8E
MESPSHPEGRPTLLVGESDRRGVSELRTLLAGEPIDVLYCEEAPKALLLLGRTAPDAVLLGSMDGPIDPLEFLRIVRSSDRVLPVVVGVPPGDASYAETARSLGATRTVERPYRADTLLPVLRSLVRGLGRDPQGSTTIDLGRLRVDGEAPAFRLDGRLVALPPTEYLLLRHLARNVDTVVSRQELIRAAWAGDAPVRTNTLNVHVMRLRRRLGDDRARPRWISTVHGVGYRLTVPESGM